MKVFGPVPSRRLGQSIGINNIPPKKCSYSCVYCQLGRTDKMQIKRQEFYKPEKLFGELESKLNSLKKLGENVDYITFVADGEPELDINLGNEIEMFQGFGIKIAVICNASLIWDKQVRQELKKADWVSLKVDSVDADIWRKIDRPHGRLRLDEILGGILKFADEYEGTLVTETMLVSGMNDTKESLNDTAAFIKKLNPSTAYILVPTRPPAEGNAVRPDKQTISRAYGIFFGYELNVQCITGDEGDCFVISGDIRSDILDITSVHPIKEHVLKKLLEDNGAGWSVIEELLRCGEIENYNYEGSDFYVKKIGKRG